MGSGVVAVGNSPLAWRDGGFSPTAFLFVLQIGESALPAAFGTNHPPTQEETVGICRYT